MSACNSKTVIDYFIANRKLSELFLHLRVYRRSDIGSNQFLTLDKLIFPTKGLHLSQNTASKENKLHYEIRLPDNKRIKWFYEQRIQQKLQELP